MPSMETCLRCHYHRNVDGDDICTKYLSLAPGVKGFCPKYKPKGYWRRGRY